MVGADTGTLQIGSERPEMERFRKITCGAADLITVCRTCLTRYHTHALHYSLIRHSSFLVQYIVSSELYQAPQTLQYTRSTLFESRSLVNSFAICPLLSPCKTVSVPLRQYNQKAPSRPYT
ncbi:uncharacterized protein BDR25DRAFT_363469 [Lindgomyces ingoldianus]|uniref:Uncharacterized protein n=1 Tax=Lindgomyces ingoldianus TaxID=673940 RepID=A0ACB6Q7N0_9PLEO|nr:uncharacterized protein BDR25DRAFT_363469 [Lindgomyces ingoldianus]KAF2462873.1 hypothetical protein BDR25DRAFT_363469 [Lindgomyces ingoldianus]